MSAKDWIALARPSNLPTVWTNVLAGAVLAGGDNYLQIALLAAAGSIFYCAGMILNDAFDREIDRRERPERPIPSGRVAASTAFLVGFVGLGMGIYLARYAAPKFAVTAMSIALATAIVLYDLRHKKYVLAPFIMGLCRALLYLLAAVAVAPDAATAVRNVMLPAAALWAWTVGLTFVARAESTGRVPKLALGLLSAPALLSVALGYQGAVATVVIALLILWTGRAVMLAGRRAIGPAIVSLIAGISAVDAVALAGAGAPVLAIVAFFGVPATLRLQAWVRGT